MGPSLGTLIQYARSGDVNIAYLAVGEGPIDVIRTIATQLGMNMDQAIRQTYADLYRQARRTRGDLPEHMVFPPEEL